MPHFKLMFKKALYISRCSASDNWAFWLFCLDKNKPIGDMPSCPSSYLNNQGKYPLSCAKVGHCEPLVGHKDTHDTHTRKVEAFRDHLRAHEHIDLPMAENVQSFFHAASDACDIRIEAGNTQIHKSLAQLLFNAFGPIACPGYIERATGRARLGLWLAITAIMAEQAAAAPVVGKGNRAMIAEQFCTTGLAHKGMSKTSPI